MIPLFVGIPVLPRAVSSTRKRIVSRRQTVTLVVSLPKHVASSWEQWRALAVVAAVTERGAIATKSQRRKADQIVDNLVLSGRCDYYSSASSNARPITGRFRLLYASTRELYRSSIFFWAFKQFFSGSERTAEAIFRITGSLPGVHVHSAEHIIAETEVRSEVDLDIWPGFRGLVVTTGRLATPLRYDCGEDEQQIQVETTRVLGSNLLPVPAVWAVDVGNFFEAFGGPGKNKVKFRILHGDDFGHVMRIRGGVEGKMDTFVYERIPDKGYGDNIR